MLPQQQTTQLSQTIAIQAVKALHDDNFTSIPGYCMRFARQVMESVGGRTQAVMDEYRRDTALHTMNALSGTFFDVWNKVGRPGFIPTSMHEGDLIFKGLATSGINGHVGIAVAGHRVGLPDIEFVIVENSSYHENPESYGTVHGAKGFRTVYMFGQCELIARLTETA